MKFDNTYTHTHTRVRFVFFLLFYFVFCSLLAKRIHEDFWQFCTSFTSVLSIYVLPAHQIRVFFFDCHIRFWSCVNVKSYETSWQEMAPVLRVPLTYISMIHCSHFFLRICQFLREIILKQITRILLNFG